MLITRKRLHSIPPPQLYVNQDTQLSRVNSVKYLGIHLTTDMLWATHITNICAKTRKLIGLMYRQFHLCKPETALLLYKTFIRPHMEYASIMWDPHQCKDIQMLENTQKFALRVCYRDWSSHYVELLDRASLPSLANRRRQAKLCHLFKIIHGLTDCQCAPIAYRQPLYKHKTGLKLKISMPTHPNFCTLFTPTPYPYGIHYPPVIRYFPHYTPLNNHYPARMRRGKVIGLSVVVTTKIARSRHLGT